MTTLWDPSKGDVHNLDAVPIGRVTPSTGAFTTVSATTSITAPTISATTSFSAPLIQGSGASVTAGTTHTIAGATALTASITLVNAANAGDGVKLPISAAGMEYVVITVGSTASPAIYPGVSTDTIDGGSAGAAITVTAANRGATLYCAVAGNWVSSLFGAV